MQSLRILPVDRCTPGLYDLINVIRHQYQRGGSSEQLGRAFVVQAKYAIRASKGTIG
jgi:hypothetical protein